MNSSPAVCVAPGKLPAFSEPISSLVKQGLTGGKTWLGHGSTMTHLHLLGEALPACLEGRCRAASQHMALGEGGRRQMSVKGFE